MHAIRIVVLMTGDASFLVRLRLLVITLCTFIVIDTSRIMNYILVLLRLIIKVKLLSSWHISFWLI